MYVSPSLTLGKVFSINSQTFSNKTFMSKWFLVLILHFLKIKQSDGVLLKRVWFGPCNSFGFFQTSWYSSRFGADAHRHQVYLDCRSSRLVLGFTPWRFRSTPPLSRLWSLTTPSPSTPPCAPTASGENLLVPFILWSYIYICYADHMDWSALKYRRRQLLASLHWCGAWGDTCGGKLALRAGGRRQYVVYLLFEVKF